jgi:UDP-N-acetylglucosamine:LPS N-acetylglucosamine transferase
MVLARWTERIPSALTEADAHLGLANRLAVPFASACSSRIRSGARSRSTASSAADPVALAARAARRGARELRAPVEGRVLLVAARSRARGR